jgi:hypothetical protein
MWSCKFAIELKYVRFNNKRKKELTDMVRYRLLLCTYTNTMGQGSWASTNAANKLPHQYDLLFSYYFL